MPVIGYPVEEETLTRDQVRRFMRDTPGPVQDTGVINILLDNVEFSDKDIDAALVFTIDYYNALTPRTLFDVAYLPRIVLLYGAVSHLMLSEGLRQLRNQATVQDGNVQPIGIDDKQALYQNWAQYLRSQFMELARNLKTEWNMNQAFGGFSSGYKQVGRYHHA